VSIPASGVQPIGAMTLLADGRIVVGGSMCFRPDGSRDSSMESALSNVFVAVAMPDGGLVVGTSSTMGSNGVVRLRSDGSSLGGAGIGLNYFSSMAVQPDGKVLAGGAAYTANSYYPVPMVRRLNANLVNDSTFSTAGLPTPSYTTNIYRGPQLVLQENGRIIVNDYYGFNRLNADGTLDASFGVPDVVVAHAPADARGARVVLLQDDGRWLMGDQTFLVGGLRRSGLLRLGSSDAPTIAMPPSAQSKVVGDTLTFTVVVLGATPLSFHWFKNGTAIAGATSASLTLANVTEADAGSYTVTVTNACGAVTSSAATLTVNPPIAPAITIQPKNQGGGVGQSVTFTVVATGSPAPTYQWSKDGTAITAATGASYTIASVQTSDAGSYSVVATNSAGSAPSNAALLTVLPAGTSATHAVVGAGYTAGGTVTITNTITYVGTATGLGWQVLLPDGWSFASGSDTPGQTKPAVGATGSLEWTWTTIPASPVTFTYTLNVPANAFGSQELAALAIVQLGGDPLHILAKPDPLIVTQVLLQHSADTDRDWKLSLLELTRVIALYNTRNGTVRTGCYSVQPGSEDGFAPEPMRAPVGTVTLTRYHNADTDHNGKVGLVELTRVIELYNTRAGTTRTGQYHVQAGTEDGYAPGP
jgi:hypothetical protein